ncbi:hypothetical protein SeLEV6574_g03257 [Synchytrium endobioticum]|nr:hypothetical protein SeLEV6574_g03257 [Synchytrium endobioticum]
MSGTDYLDLSNSELEQVCRRLYQRIGAQVLPDVEIVHNLEEEAIETSYYVDGEQVGEGRATREEIAIRDCLRQAYERAVEKARVANVNINIHHPIAPSSASHATKPVSVSNDAASVSQPQPSHFTNRAKELSNGGSHVPMRLRDRPAASPYNDRPPLLSVVGNSMEPLPLRFTNRAFQTQLSSIPNLRKPIDIPRSHQILSAADRMGLFVAKDLKDACRDQIHSSWRRYQTEAFNPASKLGKFRSELPIVKEMLQYLKNRDNALPDVLIVDAPVGTGKTTEMPQLIWHAALDQSHDDLLSVNVLVVNPYATSCIMSAYHVAELRKEVVGDIVGFASDHEARPPSYGGCICFVTPTVLLREYMVMDEQNVRPISRFSHIVLDEVQENDAAMRLALTSIVQLLYKRELQQKLVVMATSFSKFSFAQTIQVFFQPPPSTTRNISTNISSPPPPPTIDTIVIKDREPNGGWMMPLHHVVDKLKKAFPNAAALNSQKTQRVIEMEDKFEALYHRLGTDSKHILIHGTSVIPKRTPAIAELAREVIPFDLIALMIVDLLKNGTDFDPILVFLPHLSCVKTLFGIFAGEGFMGISFIHGEIHSVTVVEPRLSSRRELYISPLNARKIIFATDICETCVAVPLVGHVLDAGFTMKSDGELPCVSHPVWASREQLDRRAALARRYTDGKYYAFYSAKRYDKLPAVRNMDYTAPGMMELVLALRRVFPESHSTSSILQKASSFRSDDTIKFHEGVPSSLTAAMAMRLTAYEVPTILGRIVGALPVPPNIGKILFLGSLFSCLDPCLTIAAILLNNATLIPYKDSEPRAHMMLDCEGRGSLFGALNLYNEWSSLMVTPSKDVIEPWLRQRRIQESTMVAISQSRLELLRHLARHHLVRTNYLAQSTIQKRSNNELTSPKTTMSSFFNHSSAPTSSTDTIPLMLSEYSRNADNVNLVLSIAAAGMLWARILPKSSKASNSNEYIKFDATKEDQEQPYIVPHIESYFKTPSGEVSIPDILAYYKPVDSDNNPSKRTLAQVIGVEPPTAMMLCGRSPITTSKEVVNGAVDVVGEMGPSLRVIAKEMSDYKGQRGPVTYLVTLLGHLNTSLDIYYKYLANDNPSAVSQRARAVASANPGTLASLVHIDNETHRQYVATVFDLCMGVLSQTAE